ncbi:MAG: PD-(D/E)XK nuclease family protein [Bdellovibrionia bacterium]
MRSDAWVDVIAEDLLEQSEREWVPQDPAQPTARSCPDSETDRGSAPQNKPLAEGSMSHRELGSRIHQCLEFRDFQGLKELEQIVGVNRFQADPLIQWTLQSSWMNPADESSERDVWRELQFEVPLGSQVIVGSMDRVILEVHAGVPQVALLDFKFTQHARSPSRLIRAYQLQMQWYAWALGKLEPRVSSSAIQAFLVNVSLDGVQTVEVPLESFKPEVILEKALALLQGGAGEPKPSASCRSCAFQALCEASPKAQADGDEDLQLSLGVGLLSSV